MVASIFSRPEPLSAWSIFNAHMVGAQLVSWDVLDTNWVHKVIPKFSIKGNSSSSSYQITSDLHTNLWSDFAATCINLVTKNSSYLSEGKDRLTKRPRWPTFDPRPGAWVQRPPVIRRLGILPGPWATQSWRPAQSRGSGTASWFSSAFSCTHPVKETRTLSWNQM